MVSSKMKYLCIYLHILVTAVFFWVTSHRKNETLLQDAILPLSAAAMALPPLSIRGDLGVLSTAAARYAPSLLKSFVQMGPQGALGATKLLRPFSEIIDSLELKDPFIRNWVDLLAFLLAGVKSNGILSAEMVNNMH